MSKKIQMAVAAALAMGASAAQAGITIPAGDWTIDIGGNVNGFATFQSCDSNAITAANIARGQNAVTGGIAGAVACNTVPAAGTTDNAFNINTGLLPSALGVGGKTRQNDLDVAFQFTFFPGISAGNNGNTVGSGVESSFGLNTLNIRQAYLTFGDKSWGSVKVGRDLGIYGSDAILNDMTLLGVGGAGYASGTTTLGRIGTGFVYADWNAQISYASPNWNGFSFKAGIFDPWASTTIGLLGTAGGAVGVQDDSPQYQGQVSYEWGGDVSGKVWAGGIYQDFANADEARGWEIGGKVSVAGFTAVGYYYDGEGVGTTGFGNGAHGAAAVGGKFQARDSDGWYVQGTYAIPTWGTKIGVAYGESNLDCASAAADGLATTAGSACNNLLESNQMWTVGVYHPLTKNLNLVFEYNDTESETQAGYSIDDHGVSLGAILFF